MALFKVSKGLAKNLMTNVPNAKEGFAYFTTDDGKFYIDIAGDGTSTTKAVIGTNRIPLNAYSSDVLKAGEMSTTDDVVYPILAFKITDSTKNLVEAKYGNIGFKNGTLVIPNNTNKDEILISNEGSGRGIVIDNKSPDNYGIEIKMGKGIKVAKDPVDKLELATKQYVDGIISANDAMVFKGILDDTHTLPTTHDVGWTYRVNKAGTYAGQVCEIGDLVICISAGISANNSHWTVAQTNIDGAVIGPTSAIDNHIAVFNNTTGKVIKDSGFTLNDFATANHNHDSNYVKKTGDTMTGQLAIDKAGYGFRVNNGPTGYIGLTRDNGGAQLYGLWDYIKRKWIVQSDGATVCFDGYSIQSNGTKGIVVTNSDYGITEIGSYLDFHKNGTQDYNGRISCLNDWNFIGKNGLYFQGTTTTTDDSPTTLFIGTKDTTTGFTDYGFIASYAAHSTQGGYGANMLVQSGGNLIIGSGESPSACYSNKVKNQTNENLYITSDNTIYFYTNCNTWAKHTEAVRIDTSGKLWGAVWNDYAECREADTIEPGKCVIEVGDDTLITSTERLMPGANITSDTFGFSIGETEQAKTPIAVSGRVLAYPYESREEFKKNIGRPVCSGPNGTVSIMTDEEYREKGYCAIGTISAVPDYEEWGTGKVKVNGRVWIKVF